MKSLLFIVSLFILSGSYFAQAEVDVDSIGNPVKATAQSVAAGRASYDKKCFVCHGTKADGEGPAAGSFEVEPWNFIDGTLDGFSDGFLFQQIKNGGEWYEMPPFGLEMKDSEIWNVINYLRSLTVK